MQMHAVAELAALEVHRECGTARADAADSQSVNQIEGCDKSMCQASQSPTRAGAHSFRSA
jgi:hypothetical protein